MSGRSLLRITVVTIFGMGGWSPSLAQFECFPGPIRETEERGLQSEAIDAMVDGDRELACEAYERLVQMLRGDQGIYASCGLVSFRISLEKRIRSYQRKMDRMKC
ncbi:hypothetical protein B5E41_29150 [Rhizobium esperanzae]|uniref:Uncharacterized protein n=1 Tax=Rhizobium esperanzae TaxID=1967781 RepID=A0A246DLC2_9HYPH|nr:hypothetical protein B5E41_29150 [Rhizobium esperanzae]